MLNQVLFNSLIIIFLLKKFFILYFQPNETVTAEKLVPRNPKPFSETYHQIPNLLPQKMADNLSVALAFAALLHLANENTLHLAQEYGNLDDFVIVHPK